MGLWGGRFDAPSDDDLRALNDSIGFDQRFAQQDIQGSIAYAHAIADAKIITQYEAQEIISGLEQVASEFTNNIFEFKDGDEDIHTAVERRLIEIVGDVGGKLHTARSRNDQVATDFRMWVRDAIRNIQEQVAQLQSALVEQAEQHLETPIPGYTHLQPAQPITVAHWLMSFFWMLQRDQERFNQTYDRTSVMPLGSGALAGNPFPIDREKLAERLDFASYSQNSLDAVSDRDFVAETLFDIALMATHLSRLAEDVIIYSNPAFGFIKLNDRYSTGSSLMPQKRNADPMELARGKTGRFIGHVTALLTTLKGIPSTYNKDLQEDKEAIFDAYDNITKLLPVVTAIIKTLNINVERTKQALTEDMLATDVADYLVKKGMPFRQAHHVVGQLVRLADDQNITLSQIALTDMQEISDLFTADVAEVFDFERSISQRNAPGSTAPDAVKIQIEQAKTWLTSQMSSGE